MQWIIPCDLNYYDAKSAFETLNIIDWRQHNRFNIDDIVYIYASVPYQRIMFKTRVIAVDLSYEETIDDRQFWTSKEDIVDEKKRRYVRLQLMKIMDSELLNLEHLMTHGLKKAPQGAVKCAGDKEYLGEYIDSCFNKEMMNAGYDEMDLNEVYVEGSVVIVQVNRYERNQEARQKCIDMHGCQCKICGFDFEKVYREAGKGLIHVHHVIPISSIKEEYRIDEQKDLIPVCPNCHAMIHRKKNPYSIDEIREMITNKLLDHRGRL